MKYIATYNCLQNGRTRNRLYQTLVENVCFLSTLFFIRLSVTVGLTTADRHRIFGRGHRDFRGSPGMIAMRTRGSGLTPIFPGGRRRKGSLSRLPVKQARNERTFQNTTVDTSRKQRTLTRIHSWYKAVTRCASRTPPYRSPNCFLSGVRAPAMQKR
jgi:hypothetical protein